MTASGLARFLFNFIFCYPLWPKAVKRNLGLGKSTVAEVGWVGKPREETPAMRGRTNRIVLVIPKTAVPQRRTGHTWLH